MFRAGWQRTFAVNDVVLDEKLVEVRSAEPNTTAMYRALTSLYYLSWSEGNKSMMVDAGYVEVLTEAVKNGRNGGREQSIALGALRNLAADPDTKLRITRHSGEVIIAVCWAVDDLQCKARALGILGNVCAEEACGNFLVDKGLVEVAMLTLKDTVDGGMDLNGTEQEEQQVRTLAMIVLYNLAVQRRFRRVLKEADLLSVLSPLLTRSGLIMLLATVASMHLIGGESKHPLLIFNDRQDNIPSLVSCLEASLHNQKVYGILWNPRHLVQALATAILFEPNMRKAAKLGADKHLKEFARTVTDDIYTLKVAREVTIQLEQVLAYLERESRAKDLPLRT